MDGLKEYQRRKLALADMVRAALYVARATHDEHIEAQSRSLLTRLAADRFTLAVVGQFSRGKSTLMNAILGADYLPTGVLPMTSVITTVRYGVRKRATFLRRDSRVPLEVPLVEVSGLVAQSSALRAELQVTSVDIELPAELLRLGFAFVDTPGVGSSIGVNTASTSRFLPEINPVVFVTGFDSLLTEAEMRLLREISAKKTKLFFVINKRDLVDESTARDVVTFARQALDGLGFERQNVFVLSALNGLRAKRACDHNLLAASGLPTLETALEEVLMGEKLALLLRNIAMRASAVVARQFRDLQLGRLERDGRADPTTVLAAFSQHVAGVRSEQRAIVSKIRDRIATDLPRRLEGRSVAWRADLENALLPEAERVISSRLAAEHMDPPQNSLRADFESASEHIVSEWARRRSADVTELVVDLVAGEIGQLFELARSPGHVGAKIAGMHLPEDDMRESGWVATDVPMVAVPRLAWSVPIERVDLTHFRAATRAAEQRRRLLDASDGAILTAEEQLCHEFVSLARRWADELADQVERRTSEDAARFVRNLRTSPSDDDLAALSDVMFRLAGFQGDVGLAKLPASPAAVPGELPQSATALTECVVCVRMREALVDYLSASQFHLATQERFQEEHAREYGYCSLHTWTYFTMASPLGISAGYAALADAFAHALETASAQSPSVRDLAQAVGALVVRRDRCPVCRELGRTEHDTIAERARAYSGDADAPTLCVAHVAQMCAAEPTAERAHSAVRRVAGTLRRDAEDMRAYALKREALYRSLITSDEAGAYRDALRMLAGDPALSRPSSGNKDLEFPSNDSGESG